MSSEGGIGKVIFANFASRFRMRAWRVFCHRSHQSWRFVSTCMRVIPLGEASLANLGGLVLCRISKSFATSPAEVAYTQP